MKFRGKFANDSGLFPLKCVRYRLLYHLQYTKNHESRLFTVSASLIDQIVNKVEETGVAICYLDLFLSAMLSLSSSLTLQSLT